MIRHAGGRYPRRRSIRVFDTALDAVADVVAGQRRCRRHHGGELGPRARSRTACARSASRRRRGCPGPSGDADLERAGGRLRGRFLARRERAARARRRADRVLADALLGRGHARPPEWKPTLRGISGPRCISTAARCTITSPASAAEMRAVLGELGLLSGWPRREAGRDMDGACRAAGENSMIGRLNHVAIAVRDIAKASDVYRQTLGAEVSAAGAAARPRRHHRVHHAAEHQDRAARAARRRTRRSRNSSSATPTAASTTSATRSTISVAARDKLKAQGARVLGDGEPRSAPTASRCCSCIPRISAARWSSSSRRDGAKRLRLAGSTGAPQSSGTVKSLATAASVAGITGGGTSVAPSAHRACAAA